MIAESGAPARAIRRASPARPLWPETPRRLRRRLDPAVDRLGVYRSSPHPIPPPTNLTTNTELDRTIK